VSLKIKLFKGHGVSNKNSCETVLLTDEPASKDAFGSHDKIVSAITEILEYEEGGKTIGIEGVWGSGKSTVVKLLKEKLQESSYTTVITFDAWMHEGDRLRRSFLERIITSFIERNWIAKAKWTDYLETLAHRQSTRKQTTTPKLTGQGVAIAASLLATPVGGVIFSRGFALIGKPAADPDVLLWAGGIIVTGPVLLAAIFSIYGFLRGRGADDLFRILANKVITEETTVSTEDPEPTSIEFTNKFFDVMKDALGNNDELRAVLIVDNLDRVPGSYARQIWAALRTFLEHSDTQRPDWFKRLWIVVPYAHQSLATGNKSSTERSRDDDEEKLASFIDKVFQIRFYLSSPVLSDWKEYLLEQLKIAFPKHAADQEEFQNIFNVINLRRAGKKSPTPREVVLFINDVGALHRQWQHAFKLSHMAYYAHLRREELDILPLLEKGKIPVQAELELLGAELPYNTAALYFNRDVELARQILLKAPIEKFLGDGDSVGFLDLTKKHSKLFPVLQNSLQELLNGWTQAPNTNKVAFAADCLLDPGVLTGATEAESNSIRQSLVRAAKKITKWIGLVPKVCSGLAKLVSDSKDPDLVKKVQASLFDSYTPNADDRKPEADVARRAALEGYVGFLKVLKAQDLLKEVMDRQLIPGKARDWIFATAYFSDADIHRDISEDATLNVTPVELTTELVANVNAGEVTNLHVNALHLAQMKQSVPVEPLGAAIFVRFNGQPELPGVEIVCLVTMLQMGRKASSNTMTALNQLSNTGQFFHHISNAFKRKDFRTAAYLTVAVLESRPDMASDTVGNSADGMNQLVAAATNPPGYPAFVQAFTELFLIDSFVTNFAFLYSLWSAAPRARNLVKAVLLALAKQERLLGRLTVKQLIGIWQELDAEDLSAGKDPLTLIELIKAIDKDSEFTKHVSAIAIDAGNARLYTAVVLSHDHKQEEFLLQVGKLLGALDKTIWMSDLENKGQLGKLVQLLQKIAARIVLRDPYLDALVDYAVKVMNGNIGNAYPVTEWTAMLSTLHPSLRVRFKEILIKAAMAVRGAVKDQFFEFFGPELIDIEVLSKIDDLVAELFTPLVESRNVKGLSWIASVIEANNGGLDGFKNSNAIDELRMRLTTALRELRGHAAEPAIQKIFDAWKVSGPELPKDAHPNDKPDSGPTQA